MRDKLFSFFISQFGEAASQAGVPDEAVVKFQGVLPDQLLVYWKSEGWCGYRNGLFWTVNPDDYADVLDMWLQDTPFEEIDRYHVIARTAFGKLFAWGRKDWTQPHGLLPHTFSDRPRNRFEETLGESKS